MNYVTSQEFLWIIFEGFGGIIPCFRYNWEIDIYMYADILVLSIFFAFQPDFRHATLFFIS